MAVGQASKKTFNVIKENIKSPVAIDYPLEIADLCKFCLNVYANPSDSDNSFENDFNSFLFGYPDVVTGATLELHKCGEKVADLINNDYGEFFGYNFFNDGIKKYIGQRIDWLLVYNAFGAGTYTVVSTATLYDGSTVTEESFEYNLRLYSPALTDGSVRFEFTHNGIIGDLNNPSSLRSYNGLNWANQIRLRGLTYTASPTYEQEEIQYWNGETQDVKNELTVEYKVLLRPVPYDIHKYVQIDVLQADSVKVSDYNSTSPLRPFLDRDLKFAGGYEINQVERAKNSSATITFKDKFNNFRKRFC